MVQLKGAPSDLYDVVQLKGALSDLVQLKGAPSDLFMWYS